MGVGESHGEPVLLDLAHDSAGEFELGQRMSDCGSGGDAGAGKSGLALPG